MTARSWVIFKLFGIQDFAWLHESPSLWLNKVAYIYLKQVVCDMQVVNGTVECVVKDV